MSLVPITDMLHDAKKNRYAVGHFNMINMEFAQAICEAASEERAPVILGVGEATIQYMGIDYVVSIAECAAKRSRVPVALHLDHGSSFPVIAQCIRAGFSSVMIDGSHHPLEQNVALTQKVVELAHAAGVSVEGELGSIAGTEEDVTVEEKDAQLPTVEEAVSFWEQTKVDVLAVAVGTAHGLYQAEPNVRCDRIADISSRINAPLVLHGGSGVKEEVIQQAISAGAAKINVNTENQVAFAESTRSVLNQKPVIADARDFLREGRAAIKETVRAKIRLFGSNNRV
ncbi:class II fructose-1,6-bisphosphate aldolase [Domibacillus robiginosus]|uniref:class II fructose-1,6-bisphosphate aldolase n=1 Tax=Domibacillus robiginosus TaxID=1071054 RepID=UPI00067C8BD5|nr:class II fructose-1,6-bisphosphate aldolase [Domibacillus robiginosus]